MLLWKPFFFSLLSMATPTSWQLAKLLLWHSCQSEHAGDFVLRAFWIVLSYKVKKEKCINVRCWRLRSAGGAACLVRGGIPWKNHNSRITISPIINCPLSVIVSYDKMFRIVQITVLQKFSDSKLTTLLIRDQQGNLWGRQGFTLGVVTWRCDHSCSLSRLVFIKCQRNPCLSFFFS